MQHLHRVLYNCCQKGATCSHFESKMYPNHFELWHTMYTTFQPFCLKSKNNISILNTSFQHHILLHILCTAFTYFLSCGRHILQSSSLLLLQLRLYSYIFQSSVFINSSSVKFNRRAASMCTCERDIKTWLETNI